MTTYAELQGLAEAARRRLNATERPRLAVGIDTSSIALGARETLAALREAVTARGLDVDVVQVGGNGLSFANPVVELATPAGDRVLYQQVKPVDAVGLVEALLVRQEPGNPWLLGSLQGSVGLQRMAGHPWWAVQTRRLMQDMGVIDPDSIEEAIARGAYAGLDRALGLSQEEVIAEMLASRVRGRSGSDFPTGRKWDFLRTSTTQPKAIICNADEGDPGAWINRMTLENDPHALIEGMIIAAWGTGAQHGIIYIREEYPLAYERVALAVESARQYGLLGAQVLGRDFAFDIELIRGAGSYVCGEETGLIASIEDGRGMPKVRPPFPAAAGVHGYGSNVNNVETFHSAAWLFRNGLEKYLEIDTGRNAGTMMFTLSGHVQRVGCFEIAMSASVRELYEVCGGGAPDGHVFKAMQPGGPLLGIMPEFSLELPLEPEAFRERGMAAMGGGGMVFLDERACIVDLCAQFEWFLEDESCGRCTTCHGGTQRMTEIMRRIQDGGGRESDMGKLRLLASTLRYSNCAHGQAAPSVVVNALDWFKDEVDEHIFQRHCRAGVCKGLTHYEVTATPASGETLEKARRLCLNVLTGVASEPCLNCAVCHDLLPETVRVASRFQAGVGPAPELTSVQPAAV